MRFQRRVWLLVFMLGLVACGGEAVNPPSVGGPSPQASQSPAVVSTAASMAASPFASLPQSRTAEGYYVLGDPQTPLAIEFYSDFL